MISPPARYPARASVAALTKEIKSKAPIQIPSGSPGELLNRTERSYSNISACTSNLTNKGSITAIPDFHLPMFCYLLAGADHGPLRFSNGVLFALGGGMSIATPRHSPLTARDLHAAGKKHL